MTKNKNLTAYCGLYCGDCLSHQGKIAKLANDLMSELNKWKFYKYAALKELKMPEFKNYNRFQKLLAGLTKLHCRNGCRGKVDSPHAGNLPNCRIKKCAQKLKLNGCWECDKLDKCKKLRVLASVHGKAAINNLRKIKRLGIKRWFKIREKHYAWM